MKRLVSWLRRKSVDTMFVGPGLAFLVALVIAEAIDWLIDAVMED
jgi:hypothetical protein